MCVEWSLYVSVSAIAHLPPSPSLHRKNYLLHSHTLTHLCVCTVCVCNLHTNNRREALWRTAVDLGIQFKGELRLILVIFQKQLVHSHTFFYSITFCAIGLQISYPIPYTVSNFSSYLLPYKSKALPFPASSIPLQLGPLAFFDSWLARRFMSFSLLLHFH